MSFHTLDDLGDVRAKRVLVRVDLNVPMDHGRVTDATRIERVVPTVRELAERGAVVILTAHFGRPKGKRNPDMSLEPVVVPLAERLTRPVAFAADCVGEVAEQAIGVLVPGEVILLENTRFHAGDEANDPDFAGQLAALAEIYVNDAFSAAHRAHASTEGVARLLPAFAGRAMQRELEALEAALGSPQRPVAAVVGGAKVSTKIDLLENLVRKVDTLVIGGGMANTFLAARGIDIGKSLSEKELADTVRRIEAAAAEAGCRLVLPADVVLAREFAENAASRTAALDEIRADEMILDVGPKSSEAVNAVFDGVRTLVWNGPLGAFEVKPFDRATVAAARHAADLTRAGRLTSIAGGGDTVAALNHAGAADGFSYISTAGGAFLEWLEGKTLPGVAALAKVK